MEQLSFWFALHAWCEVFDASIKSYKRTVIHNALVGGVPHSGHIVWLAADVVYDNPVSRETREEYARRLGLRVIIEDDHDHLQPLDWEAG